MNTALRHWLALFAAFILIGGAFAQDAFISSLSMPRFIKATTPFQISMKIENEGPGYVTSFSVRWRVDGGPWNNGSTVNITPPGLSSGGYFMSHTHPTSLNVAQGSHTLEVNVVVASDLDQSNNTMTVPFTALSNWAQKVVLMENRTETWCQYCPASNTTTNGLLDQPGMAVVKFHLSDALDDCVECADYYDDNYDPSFTPCGMIDMGEYGTYELNSQHPAWQNELLARAAGVSPVELTMTSTLNQSTRVMTVTLNAEFTYAQTGPFYLNLYVAEDDVLGPQTSGGMGSNYVHNRVMRAMLGGATGTGSVVPNAPVVGTTYSHTYTWTVPASYDLNELYMVGVIEHRPAGQGTNRYTVNAVNSKLIGVGIEEQLSADLLSTSPNPFMDMLRVRLTDHSGPASIELITLDGRVAFHRNAVLGTDGSAVIEFGDISLAEGVYLLRLSTSKGFAEQRVLKVH